MADEIFDTLLMFVMGAENFRDVPIASDPTELAKK
jgi:hypothetical protein